jgi:poly(3-hydroxybutyrate) depolymerase
MMASRKPFLGFGIFIWLLAAVSSGACTGRLPPLGADLSKTSVSGLSSGAYMAGQFHVAHSMLVIGAGIVAGGPFGCAESEAAQAFPFFPTALAYNAALAQTACMAGAASDPDVLDSKRLVQLASDLAAQGKIDPLEGLRKAKVYIYGGRDDQTVVPEVVAVARDFYLAAGVPPENIRFLGNQPGGHAFLTAQEGNACALSKPPYVNNCGYDQAEAILAFIYGPLKPKGSALQDNFRTFSQPPYAGSNATLADEGVVYIPSSCQRAAGCRVHAVFHGCEQSRASVGDKFIRGSGFADWAETNRIIVLFPQVEASTLNPKSCWDWWGYTGLNFLTKDAPQIKAVATMLARLAEQPENRSN